MDAIFEETIGGYYEDDMNRIFGKSGLCGDLP